jgi:hypothetical protein
MRSNEREAAPSTTMSQFKNCRLLALTVLVVAFVEHGLVASQGIGPNRIAIVDEPRESAPAELSRSIGRSFEPAAPCAVRRAGATIAEIIGPDVSALIVHHYDKPAWPDIEVVTDYVRRILVALPEGGSVSSGVYWAEGGRVEISAVIEFKNGQRRSMEFANGYAHFEDASGCQWWARYLGGDRSKWVVRR